ncbi:TPM domain-containing protein [Mucilaginibacter kameinonensis]|uniref:TPM domain-containing protein n=1 Tax=Mucilaginibacter kameinonensis TaxID=452286 RepID=UPI000EF7D489|nr:TPM domain-containing protein [Mucilaginibacter kameinonensis]
MKKILFCALLLVQSVFAQIPKPQKNTYVNDFAHVLTADQVYGLNKEIYRIEKASTVQIAIVLVKTVPAKYTIEKYTKLIGKKWHVGKAHNGIVYVAAIDQHKQRIELDSMALARLTIIEREGLLSAIKPYFKTGDYNGGLHDFVGRLSQYFVPPPPEPVKADKPAAVEKPDNAKVSDGTVILIVLIVCVVTMLTFLGLVWLIIKGIKSITTGRGNRTVVYESDDYSYSRPSWFWRWRHRHYHGGNYYNNRSSSVFISSSGSSRQVDDEEDNKPSNWGNWGDSSSDDNNDSDDSYKRSGGSSSSSEGSFSSSGGSTSDW